MADDVAVLRRFNRAYTQRIGVLADSYLDTGRPLGPSRVLFEIGAGGRAGAPVGTLRARLGLDSGYLSRLLRRLEAEDLVTVEPDPSDGRQRVARLSAAGRRVWRTLDDRSERVARDLVEPLSPRQRSELAAALSTAERLLRAATITFDVVDPRSAAARAATAEYFGELDRRFPTGFDPGTGGADGDATALRAPAGAFVVARSDGTVVGCGGLQQVDDTTAEVKRMWIHPDWRGLGLGGRLLARLEDIGRSQGYVQVILDTNETLVEAVALYERSGYRAIERYNDNPYAHRWFAKEL
jgi:DNA-binding MarR family transcriptional regulator/GNAT superfamily N-acetyltransferase